MTMGMLMTGMWMQDPGSISSGNSTLLMVFIGLVALAMLTQAVALVAMAVGAGKARKRGLAIAEEVRVKAMPLIHDAHEMLRDLTPKLKVITENLTETSHMVRGKVQDFDVTATDINAKTRAQVARVDGIVTSVLNSTSEVTGTIQRGIKVPLLEISGVVNGLKAGLDVLVGRARDFGTYSPRETYRPKSKRDDSQGW
jgi:hypothetical protein